MVGRIRSSLPIRDVKAARAALVALMVLATGAAAGCAPASYEGENAMSSRGRTEAVLEGGQAGAGRPDAGTRRDGRYREHRPGAVADVAQHMRFRWSERHRRYRRENRRLLDRMEAQVDDFSVVMARYRRDEIGAASVIARLRAILVTYRQASRAQGRASILRSWTRFLATGPTSADANAWLSGKIRRLNQLSRDLDSAIREFKAEARRYSVAKTVKTLLSAANAAGLLLGAAEELELVAREFGGFRGDTLEARRNGPERRRRIMDSLDAMGRSARRNPAWSRRPARRGGVMRSLRRRNLCDGSNPDIACF